MSPRYIMIVEGTFEGFCGLVKEEHQDFCDILTECFGEKVLISIRHEWIVNIATLDPWQNAQAARLTAR